MSDRRVLSLALPFGVAAAGPAAAQELEAMSFVLIGKGDDTTIQHPGKTIVAGSLHGVLRVTDAPEGNAIPSGHPARHLRHLHFPVGGRTGHPQRVHLRGR